MLTDQLQRHGDTVRVPVDRLGMLTMSRAPALEQCANAVAIVAPDASAIAG
jgi:hypothetical protein